MTMRGAAVSITVIAMLQAGSAAAQSVRGFVGGGLVMTSTGQGYLGSQATHSSFEPGEYHGRSYGLAGEGGVELGRFVDISADLVVPKSITNVTLFSYSPQSYYNRLTHRDATIAALAHVHARLGRNSVGGLGGIALVRQKDLTECCAPTAEGPFNPPGHGDTTSSGLLFGGEYKFAFSSHGEIVPQLRWLRVLGDSSGSELSPWVLQSAVTVRARF